MPNVAVIHCIEGGKAAPLSCAELVETIDENQVSTGVMIRLSTAENRVDAIALGTPDNTVDISRFGF